MTDATYNHLRDEKSNHLLRHSKDPVNWFPYGPRALQQAKDEDKPIFLSIGYNSSHWCHVMAEQSFSDQKIAQILNDNFVCIKVDKEELPDMDNYYQLACQVMNGRGGWPLNAFLTPDMKPYFVGTYFPKTGSEGIPSFEEVITNLGRAYKEEKDQVTKNSDQVITALTQPPKVEQKVQFDGHYPNAASLLNALKEFQDNENGGYGSEPKFPHYSFLEWSIEHMLEGMVPRELGDHIIKTIEQILFGSLYDQARGGVHRYCIDKKWDIPHFEKMLYDQAGFIKLLAKASLVYPSPAVFDALINTLDYINREMLSEQGYFFAGQDSDSEGEEGLYFGFTKDEFIDAVVDFDESLTDDMEQLLDWFQITEKGSYKSAMSIPRLNLAKRDEIYSPEGWTKVRKVRQALNISRKMRIPPATDNKGVASWNFQLGSAILDVIQFTKIEAIQNAANEILSVCIKGIHETFLYSDDESRTRIKTTTTREGHAPLFEDYVFFAEFELRLYELTGQKNFLDNGLSTLEFIHKEFFDGNSFFTRATAYNDCEEYHNIHTPLFDHSHKSALGTYLGMIRKWSLVKEDLRETLDQIEKSVETLTHLSLQNPLAFGESLRALVYPDEAYRKIEVPKKWLENKSLHPFFANFSGRFVLYYQENDENSWQINTLKEVELKGTNFSEFKSVFMPPKEEGK